MAKMQKRMDDLSIESCLTEEDQAHIELTNSLRLLSLGRQKIVSDFLNLEEVPDLLIPMFKCEDDPELLQGYIELYLLNWIDYHIQTLESLASEKQPDQTRAHRVLANISELSASVLKYQKHTHKLLPDFLKDIEDITAKRIEVGKGSSLRLKKLRARFSKAIALLRRDLKAYKGE